MDLNRRKFCKSAILSLGAIAFCGDRLFADLNESQKFKMKFAPRISCKLLKASSGDSVLDCIKYYASVGFTAFEGPVWGDNKDKDLQLEIAKLSRALDIKLGCISSMNEKDFASMTANQVPQGKGYISDKSAIKEYLHKKMQDTCEVLKRLGGTSFIIGPGLSSPNLSFDVQYANAVENMKFCADYCEKQNVMALVEPLNLKSHKNQFCCDAMLGAKICKDVNSPKCKLLYDIFHEQMQVGNIDSLDACWEQIAYFHVADAPNRNEPGTGVINYKSVFKKIWDKGYRGFIGLEHHQSKKDKATDLQVLATYRDFDKYAKI